MRIMHIITRLDFGGSSREVLRLAEESRRAGFHSVIVTGRTVNPHEDLRAYEERTGVPVLTLGRLRRNPHPLYDPLVLGELVRLVRRLQPDIVHTHTSKAGVLGRIAARLYGKAAVVHTPHGHLFYGYYNSFTSWLIVQAERLAAPLADRIVLLTESSIEEHVSRKVGRREKFLAISPGIDIARYGGNGRRRRELLREKLGAAAGTRLVGWAGRLTAIKSPETFIRAAAIVKDQVPDVRFVLLGEGEQGPDLGSLAQRLGLSDRLHFLDDRQGLDDFLASVDLFVHTSRNEGFGIVLLEAMATGVPVIATAVGGVPELLDQGRAGSLVHPGDPLALARCMLYLLKNEEVARDIARKGRERAARYAGGETVRKYLDLYGEMLSARKGGSLP
jgi:glycosyltransferase involved in cell wall biosynthesis